MPGTHEAPRWIHQRLFLLLFFFGCTSKADNISSWWKRVYIKTLDERLCMSLWPTFCQFYMKYSTDGRNRSWNTNEYELWYSIRSVCFLFVFFLFLHFLFVRIGLSCFFLSIRVSRKKRMVQLALEIVKETDENLHGLDNKTNEKLLSPIENKQQQQPPTETKEMEKRERE